MDTKDMVEIIEIWKPVKRGGGAIEFPSGKNLKLIALLANGYPIELEKDYVLQRHHITQEEAKRLTPRPTTTGL